MMGQQEATMESVATEERGRGTLLKRRILMLLTVVALMMVMLAMSVAPAFAAWEANGCRMGDSTETVENEAQAAVDTNDNGTFCRHVGNHRNHVYDDRPVA